MKKSSFTPLLILGSLFFIFGFVTWVNATLIIYLKIACELNNFQSLWVTFAFYIAYFFTAIPSSWVLNKTGLKKGMMLGLLTMAIGAMLFIPAAQERMYELFLTGLFVIGTGLSLLQTASNPYITIVGPIESAAKRISWMGICNKLAGVLAPIILGSIILSDADQFEKSILHLPLAEKTNMLNELSARVIVPYFVLSITLLILSVWIYFSPLPEIKNESNEIENEKSSFWGVFKFPNLVWGVIALFLYVGVEVIAADTIGNFGKTQGFSLEFAKNFSSFTLISMVLGYILGILCIPKYLSQEKALQISAMISLLFTGGVVFLDGYYAVLCLALLGLGNALMWPAIWPLALKGLGKYTNIGSALLIMSIAGGAVLPLLYGYLADQSTVGIQKAYLILLPCYLFILIYSKKQASKLKKV